MQADVERVIYWLWLGTFAVWWISAIVVKRTIGSHSDWQSRVTVGIVGVAWWLLLGKGLPGLLAWRFTARAPVAIYAGLAMTLAGLGLALWARFYLGRNWSGFIELKQDHQLVRGGPYALVRHPIYSGFMLATLGTAFVFGELRGLMSFALMTVAWGYKSRLEETFLVNQFGAEYERYRREVKGLIPFVW